MDDAMVATDEKMLETKAGGKSKSRRGTSVASASSVVESVAPSAPMSKIRKLRSGLCRCGKHRLLFIDLSADSSGNALGFTPSSSITQYLYTQQYFDLISNTYYDRARNYDPATGTFTQQDTISLSPGDPANANLFLFAGGDPINMFDPTGHISLMSVSLTLGISAMLTGTTFGAINAIDAPKGGGVEGFFAGFAEGALFGLEAGTALSLAAAEGALPQVIMAGVFGGVASDLVDGFSWYLVNEAKPQSPPGGGQLFEDFISGFAGSSLSAALKGGVGVAEGAAVSSLTSFIGQEAHNLGSTNSTPIGAVLTNSLISGVISAIVGGTMHLTFPTEVKDAFENPKAISFVTNLVSTSISVEAGTVIKEAELLW
jgi:RHS repeat-associated protein